MNNFRNWWDMLSKILGYGEEKSSRGSIIADEDIRRKAHSIEPLALEIDISNGTCATS